MARSEEAQVERLSLEEAKRRLLEGYRESEGYLDTPCRDQSSEPVGYLDTPCRARFRSSGVHTLTIAAFIAGILIASPRRLKVLFKIIAGMLKSSLARRLLFFAAMNALRRMRR